MSQSKNAPPEPNKPPTTDEILLDIRQLLGWLVLERGFHLTEMASRFETQGRYELAASVNELRNAGARLTRDK